MKINIITEGLEGSGFGHLTRCLSLYQAFQEQGLKPTFIANTNEQGLKIIQDSNPVIFDWLGDWTQLYSLTNQSDIIVIDSYLTPLQLYESLSHQARKIIYIDDYGRLNYPSGIILNGTIGAQNLYSTPDAAHEFLIGPEYLPLRKEFWDIISQEEKPVRLNNFLLTLGGQDLRGLTLPILNILLNHFPSAHFDIVMGSKNSPNTDRLSSIPNVSLYANIDAATMVRLIMQTDIVMTAAGQTLYEVARLKKPFVAIGIIENQKYNLLGFRNAGYIRNEIWYDNPRLEELIMDEIQFLQKSPTQKKVEIDGLGSRRVVKYVCN